MINALQIGPGVTVHWLAISKVAKNSYLIKGGSHLHFSNGRDANFTLAFVGGPSFRIMSVNYAWEFFADSSYPFLLCTLHTSASSILRGSNMYVVVVIFCVLGLLVRSSSTQGFTSFFGITREKFDTTNNPEIIRHLPFILFNFFSHEVSTQNS